MSEATQCNNCKTLGPRPAIGWYQLTQRKPPSSDHRSWLDFGSLPRDETIGDFCSLRCVSEYATVEALDPAPETPKP